MCIHIYIYIYISIYLYLYAYIYVYIFHLQQRAQCLCARSRLALRPQCRLEHQQPRVVRVRLRRVPLQYHHGAGACHRYSHGRRVLLWHVCLLRPPGLRRVPLRYYHGAVAHHRYSHGRRVLLRHVCLLRPPTQVDGGGVGGRARPRGRTRACAAPALPVLAGVAPTTSERFYGAGACVAGCTTVVVLSSLRPHERLCLPPAPLRYFSTASPRPGLRTSRMLHPLRRSRRALSPRGERVVTPLRVAGVPGPETGAMRLGLYTILP